jgi:hypothetical protein
MNINDLTVGQARELAAMFASAAPSAAPTTHPFVGKYCICRCVGAGVHAGEVVAVSGDTAILRNSRRLWSWTAKAGVALSGVAQHGIKASASKLDALNPEIYLTGVCEIVPCSVTAKESIHNA